MECHIYRFKQSSEFHGPEVWEQLMSDVLVLYISVPNRGKAGWFVKGVPGTMRELAQEPGTHALAAATP